MIDLESPRPANERGWGSGWPHCQTDKAVPLAITDTSGKSVRIRAQRLVPDRRVRGGFRMEEDVDFPGGVRAEIHDLVEILLLETDRRGYDFLDPGCWGGACRDIKRPDGTTTGTPSNHSWYLALDINAPRNPNTSGPLVTDMPAWMPRLWNDYGFRWGGDYRKYGGSTVDAMHYEFVGTPADARRLTERARREFGGGGEDVNLEAYLEGQKDYRKAFKENGGKDPGEPPDWKNEFRVEGWRTMRAAMTNPKP